MIKIGAMRKPLLDLHFDQIDLIALWITSKWDNLLFKPKRKILRAVFSRFHKRGQIIEAAMTKTIGT